MEQQVLSRGAGASFWGWGEEGSPRSSLQAPLQPKLSFPYWVFVWCKTQLFFWCKVYIRQNPHIFSRVLSTAYTCVNQTRIEMWPIFITCPGSTCVLLQSTCQYTVCSLPGSLPWTRWPVSGCHMNGITQYVCSLLSGFFLQ